MKGVLNLENDGMKTKTIELDIYQFNYVKDCLNEFYKVLSKLPKSKRTSKFEILKSLVLTKFNDFNE